MRQKRIKDVERKVAPYRRYLVEEPRENRGVWRNVFAARCIGQAQAASGRKLYLEIGCGKGLFIKTLSSENLDSLYLAAEGQMSVAYRALATAAGTLSAVKQGFYIREDDVPPPRNLLFLRTYIFEPGEFFADGELNGIYLNFSDPWPKARHEKRRVTSPAFLEAYRKVLAPGGFLSLKTDNDILFEYSAATIEAAPGFSVERLTHDLYASEFLAGNVPTEYERKWVNLNRKIKHILAVKTD
ncbi:MAG: tRNA (guanosine(46)-N7)-methyltransferase TrmB [Clostridiales Family XIII bacterium]|jgi:tRNA (guanine-N7-)-methyltransferase|nr:tRNA (guanosine(46)-N7)-methyltransferase TrmB [Clostridiales Family XIII bacterium]